MKFRLSCIRELACIVALSLSTLLAAQDVGSSQVPESAPESAIDETELPLRELRPPGRGGGSEPQSTEAQISEPPAAQPQETEVETHGELVEQTGEAEKNTIEQLPEINFFVRMKGNKYLQGIPTDYAFIDCFVLGTKISVPLGEVLGVRFPEKPGERGSLALKNGEIINGRIEAPDVNLAVEWGAARISREYVKSLVRSADLYWQLKDTPNGPKWFLASKNANFYRSGAVSRPTTNMGTSVGKPIVTPMTPELYAYVYPPVNPQEFDWIW